MNKNKKNKNQNQKNNNISNQKVLKTKESQSEKLNKEKILVENKRKNINKISNKASYPQQIGEIISEILIDKIIAISVRQSENKEGNNKIKDYYFNFVKSQINTLFSLNYIFHSEEPEKNYNYNYSKYWKNPYKKNNTWVEITEPKPSKCDRHESFFVKNILLDKKDIKNIISDNIKRKSITKISQNENNDKKEIKDIKTRNKKKLKNLMNDLESLDEIGSDSAEEELIQRKEKKFTTIKSSLNKTIEELENKENKINDNNKGNNILRKNISYDNNLTRRKKHETIKFSSEDIPGIDNEFNYDRYDPPNIEILRKAQEREIKEKFELNKLLKLKKHSSLIRDGNYKLFDSDKLTFDSDGKIMKFKPISLSTLVNDFKTLNHRQEVLKPLKKLSLTNKFIKPKKIQYNKRISKLSLNIIKNPEDDPNINKEDFIIINPEKKNKVFQSGNNFSLMLPSVGVVLKDGNNVKKGNREFGKYFNKYSLEDYDKIQNDYLPKENQALIRKKSISNYNSNKLMSLSVNNGSFYGSSLDYSNPLINHDNPENNETNLTNLNTINKRTSLNISKNKIFSNIRNINMNNSSFIIDNFPKRVKNSHSFISNLSNYIKIKNVNSSSLKLELESLKDLELKNRFFSPEHSTKQLKNIFAIKFKYLFKKENQGDISKELNDLNKDIISDMEWGAKTIKKNNSNQNILFPKHQTKSRLVKELPINLNKNFKIKLPRERKSNIKG